MTTEKPAPESVALERTDEVSADLPYELQAKIFDHTATVALAGAGLSVTLIGSVLQDAPPTVWLSVVGFGAAAYTAGAGNSALVEALFRRQPTLKRSKDFQMLAGVFLGMAIGVLSYSVYVTGQQRAADPGGVERVAATAAKLRP